MSAIQIKKQNKLEYYRKELSKQANQFYIYKHFRVGDELNEIKNLYNILMFEAYKCYEK